MDDLTKEALERETPDLADPADVEEPDAYDAGLLGDYGGGDVEWWQDYIRAELGRAHEFYAAQFRSQAAEITALRGERDDARRGEVSMAQHVQHVAAEANDAFAAADSLDEFWEACGYPGNKGTLTPAEQVASIIREREAAESRAQAREDKLKTAVGALHRMVEMTSAFPAADKEQAINTIARQALSSIQGGDHG